MPRLPPLVPHWWQQPFRAVTTSAYTTAKIATHHSRLLVLSFDCDHRLTVCNHLLVMGTLMRHLSLQIPLLPRCVQASPRLRILIFPARTAKTFSPPLRCTFLGAIDVAVITTSADPNLYPTSLAVKNSAIFSFHCNGHMRPSGKPLQKSPNLSCSSWVNRP